MLPKYDHRRHGSSSSSSSSSLHSASSLKSIVTFFLFGACCFYVGILVGAHTVTTVHPECSECRNLESVMADRINHQADKIDGLKKGLEGSRFPDGTASFAAGLVTVPRDDFAKRFDVGVPLDPTKPSNDRVVLLYSSDAALPKTVPGMAEEIASSGPIPLMDDIEAATENCDIVNLILAQPGDKRQCFAMMGQFRSYHMQKFMRLPGGDREGEKLDPKAPLRLVNRGAQTSGRTSAKAPTKEQTAEYWKSLSTYLQTLDSVLEELKPLAAKVAKDNTVIVLVCNYGQSELLMNFVCNARSRNIDLSAVLVFCTDMETKELAEGLGLVAFYDKENYKDIPKEAAGRYADRTFAAMMMAKVYCVQQIALLGYDVLFQDVDIAWYRNPLDFFHDKSSPVYQHDIYFQDDGSRGLFYAPYSANTGMYYVRNNDKTRYFFNSLLLGGDLIIATKSHQIALVSLLSEFASMYGLKVKVLSRDENDFPGGHAYHNRHDFMHDLIAGKEQPYLFHMSWTANKDNKEKFFRQMGLWYLQESCHGSTASKILGKEEGTEEAIEHGSLIAPCCSVEPIFECFYSDKPSMKPCKDSPALDKGKKSFW